MIFEHKRNWLNRLLLMVPASKPGAWFFSRTLSRLDRFFLKATKGRETLSSLLTNTPIIWVTTRGARSGAPRTTPLIGTPNGNTLILVASNFGSKHAPSWYYNLKAHPEVSVKIEGQDFAFAVREVFGEEYDRLWKLAVAFYPGYEAYRERAGRHIALMLLEPKA
jgi:deazaflavin-dependent oxidoreductase (nitroreductase family)